MSLDGASPGTVGIIGKPVREDAPKSGAVPATVGGKPFCHMPLEPRFREGGGGAFEPQARKPAVPGRPMPAGSSGA